MTCLLHAGRCLANQARIDHILEIKLTGIIETAIFAVYRLLIAQTFFEFFDIEIGIGGVRRAVFDRIDLELGLLCNRSRDLRILQIIALRVAGAAHQRAQKRQGSFWPVMHELRSEEDKSGDRSGGVTDIGLVENSSARNL